MRHDHSVIRKLLRGGAVPRPPGFSALGLRQVGLRCQQKRLPREKQPLPYSHRQALRSLPDSANNPARFITIERLLPRPRRGVGPGGVRVKSVASCPGDLDSKEIGHG